jgi:hypothetical protein
MVKAFFIAIMDSPFIPSFFFPFNWMIPLPCFLWRLGMTGYGKAQPHSQSSILITPGDQWLSQWGLGQGTHKSVFLSPTEEAQ